MTYDIDRTSQVPAYLQLYRSLVREIVSGAYPPGSRLPSKRTIAADSGTSVITAEHALSLLIEEGYIESRERSGCFVSYRAPAGAAGDSAATERERGIRAGDSAAPGRERGTRAEDSAAPGRESGTRAGDNSAPGRTTASAASPAQSALQAAAAYPKPLEKGEFPFTVLARTMRKVLITSGDRILTRSPNAGCPELRTEICRYLARSRGLDVSPTQVIIGSGAEYLYGLIAQLIGRDSVIAVEDPCYRKIPQVYTAMGLICDRLPLTPDGIPTKALKETKASVLHVTPFNSFPSGITVSISKKEEYIRWAAERGGLLVEDNYDSELTVSRKPEEALFSIAGGDRVIYLNTFSKTIAPSLRTGYMVLPRELMAAYGERLGFYACSVPLFEQYVLAELLKSGDYERHVNRVRRRRREALRQQ